ncbi:glycosyltransferase family 2 protein [Methylomonas paludis]|uniref:Glycosyltransferase family 2 protein n=1 Tax=Methylomonas paludis TaxID=1173101 RepID=A0A975R9W6_9GAMM|nr:glycosyltransferase family 2 protein [Methylomonas paludis]QWF70713.1 glycosyltransferase family 2 protein [Methylomonas paludis]
MFSVVIPLYNKAHIIIRTLTAVLTQTFSEFEVVIVNDGSTDNSLEIISKIASGDARIRIINQVNQGVSVARNTGVKSANYDYIAFLDADDEWLPGYLQKMREAIQQFPDAVIWGCPSWHRNIMDGEAGNASLNRYRNKIQIARYFENPQAMPHISATVVAKIALMQIDGGDAFPPGMKCCEDWSCFNRLAFLGDFVYVGFALAIKNNGVQGQITGLSNAERTNLIEHIVNFYNLTQAFSLSQQAKTDKAELFEIFFRYDLRQRIICALKEKDYALVNYLFDNLSQESLDQLSGFEKRLYQNQTLNFIAKLYIYATKLIWRAHGFPIVGKPD